MRAGRLIRCALPPVVALLAVSCAREAGSTDELARPALSLFELARSDEADLARLDEVFGPAGGERGLAALLDALDRLPDACRPEVGRVDRLEPLGKVVVEVICRLEGGAEAFYAVELEPDDQDRPRVTAFDGPGVSWPPRRRSGDSGLSSWPEP